jgi:hypothetical protein
MDPRPACAFGALGGDDTRVCGGRPASHAAAASASPVKQPRHSPEEISPPTRRPYRARGAKRVDQFSPATNEGDDAPKGANLVVLAYRSGLAKALAIRASPFGAPSRLFCSRDRASGYWAGLMKVLCSGQAFACLHPHPSSRFRQSPVVGPDGDPRPPESVLAKHGRGRRIQTPLRKRPREAPLVSRTERNIVCNSRLSSD